MPPPAADNARSELLRAAFFAERAGAHDEATLLSQKCVVRVRCAGGCSLGDGRAAGGDAVHRPLAQLPAASHQVIPTPPGLTRVRSDQTGRCPR